MESQRFTLKWKDAIGSVLLIVIGNLLMIISSAAQDEFPTWHDMYVGLINSIKYGVVPFLLKRYFTDDVKVAQKTLDNAKPES